MKVLNLYSGIGGNRKLWKDVEVTAVEIDARVAEIYRDYFPEDNVVVTDAHIFLEENYDGGWDFIWSSPPCPTHSRIRNIASVGRKQEPPIYPDMRLYQEIIFLHQIKYSQGVDFDGEYVVENVRSYYEPLIEPQELQRHYFWSSFNIPPKEFCFDSISRCEPDEKRWGFDLRKYDMYWMKKRRLLRNMTRPEIGKYLFDLSKKKRKTISEVFG